MVKIHKKSIALLGAFIIGVSSLFTGLSTINADAASGFRDVSLSHWAAGDIAFAASKGIVNGYPAGNGTFIFRPENPVSYEEASTMLYRALRASGRAGELDSALVEKYRKELSEASIADWAAGYVAYALEEGIVKNSELASFVDSRTGTGRPAPRSDIAVWTARALDKDAAGIYYLPYTDASEISDDAAPYVDILYRHGIMRGSLMPDGTRAFQPSHGVKRSEFAAISNRVYNSGSTYDLKKETYSYHIGGAFRNSAGLRLAKDVIIMGDQSSCAAVSGITALSGELPVVHFVNSPEVQKGIVGEVKDLGGGSRRITIREGSKNAVYIINKDTEGDRDPAKGSKVSFIADGVYIAEIR